MDNFREEVAFKRNRTLNMIAYYFCWVMLVVFGVTALLNLSFIMNGNFELSLIISTVIFGALAFLIWRYKDELRIEYDYTFTNGDLDVGKVFGNSRRRLMTSLPIKNVEACGPVTDPSFQRYLTMKDVKKHNWFVNRDACLYYFYFVKNEVKHVIIVELSDEMIQMIRPYTGFGVWQEKK